MTAHIGWYAMAGLTSAGMLYMLMKYAVRRTLSRTDCGNTLILFSFFLPALQQVVFPSLESGSKNLIQGIGAALLVCGSFVVWLGRRDRSPSQRLMPR